MKKLVVTGIVIAFLFAACNNSGMDKKYIIPRNKFVDVLVEMHLMDAVTNSPEFYRKFEMNDSVNIYSGIFKKYDITQQQFDSTMIMYTRQPDKYLKVYDDVILQLNLRLDKLHDNEPSFQKEEKGKSKS